MLSVATLQALAAEWLLLPRSKEHARFLTTLGEARMFLNLAFLYQFLAFIVSIFLLNLSHKLPQLKCVISRPAPSCPSEAANWCC